MDIRAALRSPVLWLVLFSGSAVAGACGSSDSHRQTRSDDAGGAGGHVEASNAGQAGQVSPSDAGAPAGGAMDGAAGAGGSPEVVAGSPAGGDATAGAGGADPVGCPALHFGSPLDTVQIPDLTIPDFGSAGSIELWILPDTNDGQSLVAGGGLFNKWVNFQEDKYFFANADGTVSVYFAQQVANFSSTPAIVPSKWQHVALSYDATSARIYVDGVKVGEQAGVTAPANSDGNIQIGHISRDTTYPPLHGFYAEVRLSDVARYTSDFTPAPHFTADASTTGLWKLDEGSGTVATDSSDLDNPGTITGAEWQLAPCR